jgi:hypothetical protein
VPGDDGAVEARLTTVLPVPLAAGRERVHASARVLLAPPDVPPPAAPPVPEREGRVRARSFYRLSRDPVALGPLFCRARWIDVRGEEACAAIEPPNVRRIVPGTTWPVFRVDPLLLDSAFQVAGSLEGYAEGFVCVPVAIASLRVGRPPRARERARARALRVRSAPPRVFYDVAVVGDDGALLLALEGLELHRLASVEAA